MSVSIAVVCEARADLATGTGLADRIICDRVDWISESVLGDYRPYRGLEPEEAYLDWHNVPRLARERRIRALGHFGGSIGAEYSHVARQALLLLLSSSRRPEGVILLLDEDRSPERREGLDQARGHARGQGPILVGVARRCRECWVLAGFQPGDDRARRTLDDLRRQLAFDPTQQAGRLNDPEPHQPRNPKRILRELTRDDWSRQERCWRETPLTTLEAHGQATGLADFLREIHERLIPLLTG